MRTACKSPWFFALCGVVITAAIYTHYVFYDFTKPASVVDVTLGIAELALCPPSLLSVLCIDCEVGTSAGLQIFSIIALLNGGLYWLIAAFVKRRRAASAINSDQ
jgi:hypothetical protein